MSTQTPRQIRFTIDGQPFTTTAANQAPSELLALVGFSASAYDLAQVKNKGVVHTFKDNQNVHIKDGDEFLTVRREAPVA